MLRSPKMLFFSICFCRLGFILYMLYKSCVHAAMQIVVVDGDHGNGAGKSGAGGSDSDSGIMEVSVGPGQYGSHATHSNAATTAAAGDEATDQAGAAPADNLPTTSVGHHSTAGVNGDGAETGAGGFLSMLLEDEDNVGDDRGTANAAGEQSHLEGIQEATPAAQQQQQQQEHQQQQQQPGGDHTSKRKAKSKAKKPAAADDSADHLLPGGTLVVCPTSVLHQWARELKDKVNPRTRCMVHVYHGKVQQCSAYRHGVDALKIRIMQELWPVCCCP